MRSTTAAGALLCTSAMLMTGTAFADPQLHDGFYMKLGGNLGWASVSESYDVGGSDMSISGFQVGEDFLFGGSVIPGLAIGGGLIGGHAPSPSADFGGTSVELDGTLHFIDLTAFVDYYIAADGGFHLTGFLGYAFLDFTRSGGASSGNDPGGPAFGFGAGYDFWVGNEWSIGPYARFMYGALSAEGYKDSYISPVIGAEFVLN
jgi:outer membrane autotransporter protein